MGLTREQRRKNMQANKGKGTKLEIKFGKLLWGAGVRYRKNDNAVFGKPDFVVRKQKIAIFCDGEFWHGKDWKKQKKDIKSNRQFWYNKIEHNINRDKEVNATLRRQGWVVLRFWETDIEKNINYCIDQIQSTMAKKQTVNSKAQPLWEKIKQKCSTLTNDNSLNERMSIITHNFYSSSIKQDTYFAEPKALYTLFPELLSVPFKAQDNPKFTFIDLFAGIGGFRIALQNLGGKCVFSSEWDEQAQKTYLENFGEIPFGDITKEKTKGYIPDGFDVLCAGFPCQAFSLAGKRRGFDETRGTLFFDVAEIIRRKQPKAFFLENVKGLKIHDKGRTLETILKVLREDLGYYVPEPQILNAMNFGVPQHRERIYIVGFRKDLDITDFTYPLPTDSSKRFKDVKEENVVSAKYYLSTQYIKTLIVHKKRHESKGHGFGYEIIPDNSVTNAIVVGGMGRERNIVIDKRLTDFNPVTKIKGEVNHDGWRRMTPREWARLQGFPDNFIIPVADASAYKQFGNSVAVPAIQATAEQIIKLITPQKKNRYGKNRK